MGNLGNSAGRIFTCLVVTHANSLTSVRSTMLHNTASLLNGTLFYHEHRSKSVPVHRFGMLFCPGNFRRISAIDQ